MTDEEKQQEVRLLERLEKGDPAALGTLFDLHRPRLWRIVRFRMDPRLIARVDADDVIQEGFLAASLRIRHYLENPSVPIFLWFRGIVTQTLIDVHRRHVSAGMRAAGRDVSIETPRYDPETSACLAAQLIGSGTSPSQAAVSAERFAQLERAIATLTPADQEIIALRHFEDLTNLEAARLLGIAPTASSNRYIRALGRLKAVLSEFPDFRMG